MLILPIVFTFEICFLYLLLLKIISNLFSIKFNKFTLYILFIPIIFVHLCFALWALDTFLLMFGADLFEYKGFLVDRDGRINLENLFFGKDNEISPEDLLEVFSE